MRALFLLFTLLFALPSLAEGERSLTVLGTASAGLSPDLATFSAEISHKAMDAAAAQTEVEKVTRAIVAEVSSLPLLEDSLQAAQLAVAPEYRWLDNRREQVFDGYRVTRTVQFTITDLERLGDAYGSLISLGATSVQPAVLSSTRQASLEESLLARAFEDARQQANIVVAAAGMVLGDPISVHVTPLRRRPVMIAAAGMAAARAESDSGVYEPGQIEVSREVSVSFAIHAAD